MSENKIAEQLCNLPLTISDRQFSVMLDRELTQNILTILFTECPASEDGMERFACPTADRMGRYHCIDDHVLCDGFIDCPTGEDEDRQACMFYKTVSRITNYLYLCSIFSSDIIQEKCNCQIFISVELKIDELLSCFYFNTS